LFAAQVRGFCQCLLLRLVWSAMEEATPSSFEDRVAPDAKEQTKDAKEGKMQASDSQSSSAPTRCPPASDEGEYTNSACSGSGRMASKDRGEEDSGGEEDPNAQGLGPDGKPAFQSLRRNGAMETLGSKDHPDCKPCAFYCYSLRGCRNGRECPYCHMFHESKLRQRRDEWKKNQREKRGRLRRGQRDDDDDDDDDEDEDADGPPAPLLAGEVRSEDERDHEDGGSKRQTGKTKAPSAGAKGKNSDNAAKGASKGSSSSPSLSAQSGKAVNGPPLSAQQQEKTVVAGLKAAGLSGQQRAPAATPPSSAPGKGYAKQESAPKAAGKGKVAPDRGSPSQQPAPKVAAAAAPAVPKARGGAVPKAKAAASAAPEAMAKYGGAGSPMHIKHQPPPVQAQAQITAKSGAASSASTASAVASSASPNNFFTYTPNSVVVGAGQNIELWPPVPMMSQSMVFAVSPNLPAGLVLEERVGLIHGRAQAATKGLETFFVTACEVNANSSAPVKIAIVNLKVVDVKVSGHTMQSVHSPEPGVTVITLREEDKVTTASSARYVNDDAESVMGMGMPMMTPAAGYSGHSAARPVAASAPEFRPGAGAHSQGGAYGVFGG